MPMLGIERGDLDDTEALALLLLYNREDVENLAVLRERLDG